MARFYWHVRSLNVSPRESAHLKITRPFDTPFVVRTVVIYCLSDQPISFFQRKTIYINKLQLIKEKYQREKEIFKPRFY